MFFDGPGSAVSCQGTGVVPGDAQTPSNQQKMPSRASGQGPPQERLMHNPLPPLTFATLLLNPFFVNFEIRFGLPQEKSTTLARELRELP